MPFTWMPAAGRRHATAHAEPKLGHTITTLCGQHLTADGWADREPPTEFLPYPASPKLWPTCLDCEAVWRRVEELATNGQLPATLVRGEPVKGETR